MTDGNENDDAELDTDDAPAPVDFDPRTVPVRWSWLSRFSQSAAHARHAANRGADDAGTLAMKLGTFTHAVTFGQPYRIFEPGEFVDKKGKTREHKGRRDGEAWDQFKAKVARESGPNTPIMNPAEFAQASAMAHALRTDRIAAPLLFGDGVEHERLIEWERDGRRCRSRLDVRAPWQWIADLKTCRSAQPERFIRAATWAGYPGQLWFYNEADAHETGRDPLDEIPLYIVAIESVPPYVVVVYRLNPFALELGRRTVGRCWAALRQAEADSHWPGYAQSVYEFTADDPDEEFGLAEPLERPEDNAA